jgi:hypothetical protein
MILPIQVLDFLISLWDVFWLLIFVIITLYLFKLLAPFDLRLQPLNLLISIENQSLKVFVSFLNFFNLVFHSRKVFSKLHSSRISSPKFVSPNLLLPLIIHMVALATPIGISVFYSSPRNCELLLFGNQALCIIFFESTSNLSWLWILDLLHYLFVLILHTQLSMLNFFNSYVFLLIKEL